MLQRYASGLLAVAGYIAPSAVLAWAYATCLAALSIRAWPGLQALVYCAGVLALFTLALAVVSMALAAPWAEIWSRSRPPSVLPLGAMLAAACVSGGLGAVAMQLAVPRLAAGYAEISEMTFAGSVYGGAALACAGALGAQLRCQRHLGGLLLWCLPVAFAGARLATNEALQVALVTREHLMEVVSVVVGVVGFLGLRPRRLVLFLASIAAASLLWTATTLSMFPAGNAAFAEGFPGSAALIRAMRNYADLDGDGYSAVLAGADCDDTSARVGPEALEIVGNGVDDNCIGGDAGPFKPREPPWFPANGPRRSIVLVTIDAWNHTMLPARPPPGPDPMPLLRAFASGGAHFTRAYAQGNATDDGMTALHTGRYPMNSSIGYRHLGMEPTLAMLLSAAGYNTVSAVPMARVRSWPLRAGFMLVDERIPPDGPYTINSDLMTNVSLAHIAKMREFGAPFFYWVHYSDPHLAYLPRSNTPFSGDSRLDRYRQEIFSVDRELGRLLRSLQDSGFLKEGLVVVTGDHGESVLERTPYGHAWWLYEDCIRVPLVIRGAGVPAGVLDTRVQIVDLAPTLLELAAGIVFDGDGRSLAPIWAGRERDDRPALSRMNYFGRIGLTFIDSRYKLIKDFFLGTDALYDLRADPGERNNLIEALPERAAELQARLGRLVDAAMNDRILERRARTAGMPVGQGVLRRDVRLPGLPGLAVER